MRGDGHDHGARGEPGICGSQFSIFIFYENRKIVKSLGMTAANGQHAHAFMRIEA